MTEVVVFVANGFNKENTRLQPWRYVFEIAKQRGQGKSVVIITDGESVKEVETWSDNFSVIKTRFLSVKTQDQLRGLILSLNPAELWWSTTPRTVAYKKLLSNVECRLFLYMTCPLYSWHQLTRAIFSGVPFRQTKALILQRLIPRLLFRKFLNQSFVDKVFVQSYTNERLLKDLKVTESKIHLLPVGIDDEDLFEENKKLKASIKSSLPIRTDDSVIFLYFGALRPIRGFDALLKVIPQVVKKNKSASFVILARGASEDKCREVSETLTSLGVNERVAIIGGWLSKEEVRAYVEISDMAVLPFILVPSDIPIAALEALAKGKPILVSSVDGLPDMAAGRGVVIDPLNTNMFADAIIEMADNVQLREDLSTSAREYMQKYPRWNELGKIINQAI